MFINWQTRELNLKVVYYGPALSGKTTNVEHIHVRIDARRRSELISLKTQEDCPLFFDFMQLELGVINGLTPKIHLYTVPGQTYYEASRKLVLQGADGVVFVVDSAPNRIRDNLQSWNNLNAHLASFALPLTDIPTVVQFNKRDLPNAMSLSILQKVLRTNGYPTFEAIAVTGQGVFDTLKAIIGSVVTQVRQKVA